VRYNLAVEKKKYLRDGRAPVPEKESVSRVMSAIRGKNTQPELVVRRLLSSAGIRGYRLHPKDVPGRPDVAFISKKIAIFVHGCFWHDCPHCKPKLPKTHQKFWRNKRSANRLRDSMKIRELREKDWHSIVLWECRLGSERARRGFLNRLEKVLA